MFDNPMMMERCFIAEQLSEKEISAMDDAVELYLDGSPKSRAESDFIIGTELPRKVLFPVLKYRKDLEDYYSKGGEVDAEQDY